MAFDLDSLTKIGGQPQAPSNFCYLTEDGKQDVLSSGYFNGAVGHLRLNDTIYCKTSTCLYKESARVSNGKD